MGKLAPPHLMVLTNTLSPSLGFLTLPWGSGHPNSVRRGDFCSNAPRTEPCPSPGLWPLKAAQAPCSSAPSPCQHPHPTPRALSLFPLPYLGLSHWEEKEKLFPLGHLGEGGLPRPLGLPATLGVWHTCCPGPRPPPSPSSHACPPHPAGKESRHFQASGPTG